jgi:hypothetical protein
VSADLAERPGSSSLKVVFRLVNKGILKRSNTLRNNNCHSEGIIEGGDVTESHDTRKAGISLGFGDVIDDSSSTTRVNNELSQLSGLLGNFSDASGSILSDLDIEILQAVEDSGEDFSLNNDFSKINGVLSNLSKARADLSLKLSIRVRDQSSEVRNGSLVNYCLGELLSVLSDLT